MNIPIKVNVKKPYQLGVVGTPSSGGTVGEVADGSITTEKLADKSVTENKIADNSIGASKYKVNSIGGSHIASNTLLARNFSSNCIATPSIRDGAVTPEKLDREYADRSDFFNFITINSQKIEGIQKDLKLAILTPIIDPTLNDVGKVLQLKLDGNKGVVWSAEFVEGAGGVADGSVTTEKLADGSVTTDKLADEVQENITKALTDSSDAKNEAGAFTAFHEDEWQIFFGGDGMYWNDISINDESSSLNRKWVNEACVELENRIGDINAVLDAINGEVI